MRSALPRSVFGISFGALLFAALSVGALLLGGCAASDQATEGAQCPAKERAARLAYDGAPPTIPHESFGADCTECHAVGGMAVENVGLSPPSPHGTRIDGTPISGAMTRCVQCHVYREGDDEFRANIFVGLPQDLRRGERLNPWTPPVMPHASFLRENCVACHVGETAREEIRTTHPERVRCLQCHVEQTTTEQFAERAAL